VSRGRPGRARVLVKDNLAHSETSYEHDGHHHDAGVSFIVIDAPPGSGPNLHKKNPYEDVLVVQEGDVTFTAGEEVIEASAGQIVVVSADAPHKFVNSGVGRLRLIGIHASERFVTEWRRLTRPPVVLQVRTRQPWHSCRRGHIRRDGGNRR
jgi:mannose-6-phosphate isomerase-like protein (cupin superfamily)